jgi:hypothetical protein
MGVKIGGLNTAASFEWREELLVEIFIFLIYSHSAWGG